MADTRQITAWENILEDFGGFPKSLFTVRGPEPEPLTQAERIRRDSEARRATILQNDASMGPVVDSVPPAGLGPAPLPQTSMVGLTGGDTPVITVPPLAPQGDIDPDTAFDPATIADDIIADIQQQDNTRPSVGRILPQPDLSDDAKSGRGTGKVDYLSGLIEPTDSISLPSTSGGGGGGAARRERRPEPDYTPEDVAGVSGGRGQGAGRTAPQVDLIPTETIGSGRNQREVLGIGLHPNDPADLLPPTATPEELEELADEAGALDTSIFTEGPEVYQAGDPYKKPFEKEGSTTHDAGDGSTGKPSASLADDADEAEKELNWIQNFTKEKFGWDEDKRADIARALMMGGARTMAGTSPWAAVNIGKGVEAGVGEYYDAGDERRKQAMEDEAMQWKREDRLLDREKTQLAIDKARAELEKAAKGPLISDYDWQSPEGKLWADIQHLAQIATHGAPDAQAAAVARLKELGIWDDDDKWNAG